MNDVPATRDAGERRTALDPGRSFIVQAPAGSGKTGLLIQRYLALLATVEAPEEIVAITFTRKATGEMRGRVLDALAQAEGSAPGDPHERLTWELAQAARRRDADRGWQLGINPARLRIHTIDALCHHLARRMPVLSRFGGETAPLDDPDPLYREAARRSLALMDESGRFADAVKTLLLHLDNDIARYESMLRTMLAHRDQWLRYLAADDADPPALRRLLESALERAVDDALGRLRGAVPPAYAEEIAAVARYAGANLTVSDPDSAIAGCAALAGLPGGAANHLGEWRGLAALFLTQSNTWRKSFSVKQGFPPGKDAVAVEMKARAKGLSASLASDDALRALLASARSLPDPAYSDEEFRVLVALLDVLRVASAMLRVVFAERGGVDFIEMVNAARTALGDEDAPTDLALALDYRIKHLLVDEFQDTSHTHFALLRQLTAGWTPGDGKTLFAVGDPMQSIYRFREADVGVYLSAWHNGMQHVALETLTLATNFRSSAELVEWVNETFPRVFPASDDAPIGAVAYRPATAAKPPGDAPAVMVRPVLDGGEADEAKAVVACVREAQAQDPDQRIAVLVRARSHLQAILPAFEQAGIAYRGVELRSVLDVPAVHDLISLTRALMHPADRVAWLAVLRAPWCGLLLDDLAALTRGSGEATILELMADGERIERLSADGRRRLERLRPVLIEAVNRRGRMGLRRQVEGVWQALGGPALMPFTDLDDANACLDTIERYELEQRVVDIDALEARLAELRLTPPASGAAVDVMTIHKAKGLEFDCVILPGLHRRGRGDEKRLLAWTQHIGGASGSELLLAPLPRGDETGPAIYEFLDAIEKRKQALENGRLIYVAATRARRRLYLVAAADRGEPPAAVKAPRKNTLLAELWPAIGDAFEQAAAAGSAAAPGRGGDVSITSSVNGLTRITPDWALPAPAPAIAWSPRAVAGDDAGAPVAFEWAGYAVRHVGIAVHALLKRIAEEGLDKWSAARVAGMRGFVRATLAADGLRGDELESSADHVLDALSRIIGDEQGRWILDPAHGNAHNELALSGILDGKLVNVVIDRSFVDENGTRWIVDYKSGRHEGTDAEAFLKRERERYAPQLERYVRLMSGWDRRPVRAGLYFPLLRAWQEWAPATGAGK
jgi:ATP-dependent exoDNAse (exonuclease V) beta subunit